MFNPRNVNMAMMLHTCHDQPIAGLLQNLGRWSPPVRLRHLRMGSRSGLVSPAILNISTHAQAVKGGSQLDCKTPALRIP